jgi:hypothetical protein
MRSHGSALEPAPRRAMAPTGVATTARWDATRRGRGARRRPVLPCRSRRCPGVKDRSARNGLTPAARTAGEPCGEPSSAAIRLYGADLSVRIPGINMHEATVSHVRRRQGSRSHRGSQANLDADSLARLSGRTALRTLKTQPTGAPKPGRRPHARLRRRVRSEPADGDLPTGCGTGIFTRTSEPSRPSTAPSPRSTQSSGARARPLSTRTPERAGTVVRCRSANLCLASV